MTDGIWWFYLFWLPDYLIKQFGMTKHQIMLPTFIVYGVAIVGSIYGGSIPHDAHQEAACRSIKPA